MFESIEFKKVKNGFIITVHTDESDDEYIFDTLRKSMKFIKDIVENKPSASE